MSAIFLEVTPKPGARIEDVVYQAKIVATVTGATIKFEFNGTRFSIYSTTDVDATIEKYRALFKPDTTVP